MTIPSSQNIKAKTIVAWINLKFWCCFESGLNLKYPRKIFIHFFYFLLCIIMILYIGRVLLVGTPGRVVLLFFTPRIRPWEYWAINQSQNGQRMTPWPLYTNSHDDWITRSNKNNFVSTCQRSYLIRFSYSDPDVYFWIRNNDEVNCRLVQQINALWSIGTT